VVKPLCHIR